jgi:hypothetical protein
MRNPSHELMKLKTKKVRYRMLELVELNLRKSVEYVPDSIFKSFHKVFSSISFFPDYEINTYTSVTRAKIKLQL